MTDSAEHFDLVVIGAGPAGEKGAAQAAYFGKRVCIVERAPKPGGAAVNTGTIPSKTLRETALHFSGLRQRGLYGVEYHVKPDITIGDFMLRERAVIEAEWSLIAENFERHGITVVQGAATFVGPTTVEVARYGQPTRRLSADAFLIATGSRPLQPTDIAVDGEIVVDSDSLLTLQRIPEQLVVIGGGAIGTEYACTFAAIGSRVTLVHDRPRLLGHLDADVSELLRQQMTSRLGISVYGDNPVREIRVDGARAAVRLGDDTVLNADCVLFSAGRVGNTAGLGLEELGVRVNARGFVEVDEHYRTTLPHIYAAGDVVGFPALASTSMEQARVAICHAFDLRYKEKVASLLPYGIWTIPEVAMVGETEERLVARGVPYEVGRTTFRQNPRGQIIGELDGMLKLLFHAEDQHLLGVSIVGEGACELIHLGASVMAYGGTIDYFIQGVFNYPSMSDAYKYAAYDGLQALARRASRRQGLPSVALRSPLAGSPSTLA